MTQEEMCVRIQTGTRPDLVPALWDTVSKLYNRKAAIYYYAHKEQCAQRGAAVEDLQQQAFFAFLQSIDAYKPESGLPFTAYISYPFLSAMQELIGCRTAAGRNDALNIAGSLDREIETDDGGGSTLHDLIPDSRSLDFVELLDRQSVCDMIRAEVDALPARIRYVITHSYFDGDSLAEIAAALDISPARAAALRLDALRQLSRRKNLVELHRAFYHTKQLRRLEAEAQHSIDAAQEYADAVRRIRTP